MKYECKSWWEEMSKQEQELLIERILWKMELGDMSNYGVELDMEKGVYVENAVS